MLLIGITLLSAVAAGLVCLAAGAFGSFAWLWLLPVSFAGGFLLFLLVAFLFLLLMCNRVDLSKPQETDDPFYRKIAELYIASIIPAVRVHITAKGLEKTPESGRFMLVCNHTNDSDPVILLHCFRGKQLAFISKQENSTMFVVGKIMHKLLCQLINRKNDREALKTILKCIQILKEDKASIAVFPEGGIDDDGLLHSFRSGVFKIAQKAKVPIVVCTLKNTKTVIRNVLHFKRSDVELNLLEVIPAEELQGVTAVDIAHRVHKLMAEDLGPDLVASED